MSSRDRLWRRTSPQLLDGTCCREKSGSCSGTQQTGMKLQRCMSEVCLVVLPLCAWGGSDAPVCTLPCSLVLNPHLPDWQKKPQISAAAPPPFPLFRRCTEPQLHPLSRAVPRRTLHNHNCFPGMMERTLLSGSQPRLPSLCPSSRDLLSWKHVAPSQTSGVLCSPCPCCLPGSRLLFPFKERVREGQMLPLCCSALKHAAFP